MSDAAHRLQRPLLQGHHLVEVVAELHGAVGEERGDLHVLVGAVGEGDPLAGRLHAGDVLVGLDPGVGEDRAAHAAGMVDGQVLQHAAAGGGAGHMRPVDAERVHEADHVARDDLGGIAERRLVAVAGAAVVEGDAAVALGELGDLVFPGVQETGEARNEDERRAGATLLHVERERPDIDPWQSSPAPRGRLYPLLAYASAYSPLARISATSTVRPSRALLTPALMTARLRAAQ